MSAVARWRVDSAHGIDPLLGYVIEPGTRRGVMRGGSGGNVVGKQVGRGVSRQPGNSSALIALPAARV